MGLILQIVLTVLPVAIIGGIVVFIIKRLEHKYKQGTLDNKESEDTQNLSVTFIPLGMLFGCAIGIIFSMFIQTSLLTAVSLGAGIGLLFGYFVYEMYSKKGNVIHE